MQIRLCTLLVVLAVVTAGCGSSSSPTTPSVSLTGTWVGTEIDTVAGTGNLTAILTQSGSTLSGTYSLTFPNPIFSNSGTLNGTLNGSSISMTATPSLATFCPALDTATVNSAGTQITGSYAAVASCVLAHQQGSFSTTKQ
jgi:hypothetical protein